MTWRTQRGSGKPGWKEGDIVLACTHLVTRKPIWEGVRWILYRSRVSYLRSNSTTGSADCAVVCPACLEAAKLNTLRDPVYYEAQVRKGELKPAFGDSFFGHSIVTATVIDLSEAA